MAWNDGITQELSEFLEEVSVAAGRTRSVAEKVIDEEVKAYSERVTPQIPVSTGGLKASFTVKKDTSKGSKWYGYDASFEGNAPNGEPYEKIANIQNYGTPTRAGTFFITKAIKKLKGLSGRIEARIAAELEDKT